MKLSRFLFFAAIPVAGLLLVLMACSSGQQTGTGTAATQTITYKIVGHADADAKKGPDGMTHDTFFTADSTTIRVGTRVTLSFVNEDEMPHSFTATELGINVVIPAGSDSKPGTATYTFTADKAGDFRWFCALPCDDDAGGYAMKADPNSKGNGVEGLMAGFLNVR